MMQSSHFNAMDRFVEWAGIRFFQIMTANASILEFEHSICAPGIVDREGHIGLGEHGVTVFKMLLREKIRRSSSQAACQQLEHTTVGLSNV